MKRKYNHLKATKERKEYLRCKSDIGKGLYLLRLAKAYPENYNAERLRTSLSINMTWYHKMLRNNPALKGAEQLDLFKEK